MNFVRVIKNGPRYYSSFIGDRQHIYSFTRPEPLQRCHEFIADYKRIYKKYPPADTTSMRLSTRPEDDFVHTEVEEAQTLHRRCLMYNVGVVEVEHFDYTFNKGLFDVSLSAAEILTDISLQERKNLLNYALLLNDTSDYNSE